MTCFRAWLLWPLLVFLVGVLLGLLTSQLRYACGPWGGALHHGGRWPGPYSYAQGGEDA